MTKLAFSFRVPGHAVGKARPRVTSRGTFTPPTVTKAEKAVQLFALAARPRGWPLTSPSYAVELDVYERSGKGGRRGVRPDVDNVGKLVLDALHGVAYANDVAVDDVRFTRHRTDGTPCVLVTVHRSEDPEALARGAVCWIADAKVNPDPTEPWEVRP